MRCSLLVLSTHLDGELDPGRSGELEAHLVGCERCRRGLGYLGEEVQRISALAPVHVPDHSVHALFAQLGLLGTADPLPYRPTPGMAAPPAEAPTWLSGGAAGPALPWNARMQDAHRTGPPPPPADVMLSGQAQFSPAMPPVAEPTGGQASERAINPSPAETDPASGPPGSSPGAGALIADGPPPADAPAGAAHDHPEAANSAFPVTVPPVGGSPIVPPISTEPTQGYQHQADDQDDGFVDEDEQFLMGEPRRAVRPTMLDRIRDRLGTYRALARGSRVDYDDSVQIVSGAGAPNRPPRGGTMYSHSSQTLPTAAYGSAPRPSDVAGAASVYTGHVAMEPDSPFADAPPLHGEVAPPSAGAPGSVWGDEGVDDDEEGFFDRGAGPTRVTRPSALWARQIATHVSRFRAPAAERRPLALFGGAVVVLMLVGLAIGHSSTAIGGGTPTRAAGRHIALAPRRPPLSLKLKPALPVAIPPVPQPASAALTGEQDLGSGGTGYQVNDIRYGIHPGDFRIVFDLTGAGGASGAGGAGGAGGAVGTPKAVIGWTTPTTLQVRLTGVIPAGSTGQLPATTTVNSVTLRQPSPVAGDTVYQLTVTHPLTVASAYETGPLRLVLDLH